MIHDHCAEPTSEPGRRVALRTWRGLIEVLTGSDPATSSRAPTVQRALNALAAVGALLIVIAAAILVPALYRAQGPGLGFLRVNSGVIQRGASSGGATVFTKAIITPITSLKSIQILIAIGALLLALRSSLPTWRFIFLTAMLGPLLLRTGWGPMLSLRTGSVFMQLVLLATIFAIAGFRHSRAALWWMWAFMLIPVWLWYRPGWEQTVAASLVLTAIAVALDALTATQRTRRALVAQSERTELEETRRAILEERTRIARELHDVVAHHMSLIAVQAETAPYRLHDLSDSALSEFSSVSAQAREALTDMRRLLGVLRDDEPAERNPQPQLTDVPELVAVTRRVGVNVDLSMSERHYVVPKGVGLCAYRIVQEALSNACRHAPGSSVSVSVDGDDEALRLQILNGPGSPPYAASTSRRNGHGLAGMRERVAMLGGSLTAEPSTDGGFAVLAVLPIKPLVASHTR